MSDNTRKQADTDVVLGGDGTRYTAGQLRQRVSLVEPRIILLRQIPVGAKEPLLVMTDRVLELAPADSPWGLVVDLQESKGILSAEYRKFLVEHLPSLGAACIAMAMYANPVVRGVSKFVAKRLGLNAGVYKNDEEAVSAVRAQLRSS